MRVILVVVVVLLAAIGGIALALNHFFGWKGLLAFPLILIGLVWIGKIVIGKVIKGFILGLIGRKGNVLRGASMTVHGIVPIPKPPEPESKEEDEEDEEEETTDEESEPEEPKEYYEIDVTITPRNSGEGSVWEPTELMLVSKPIKSLEDLEESEVGTTYDCLIWNGSVFREDEVGKHPGEQRLKLTMEVRPGTRQAWLTYYHNTIGSLELPQWQPNTSPAKH